MYLDYHIESPQHSYEKGMIKPILQMRKLMLERMKQAAQGQQPTNDGAVIWALVCWIPQSTFLGTMLYCYKVKLNIFTNFYWFYDLLPLLDGKDLPMFLSGWG